MEAPLKGPFLAIIWGHSHRCESTDPLFGKDRRKEIHSFKPTPEIFLYNAELIKQITQWPINCTSRSREHRIRANAHWAIVKN